MAINIVLSSHGLFAQEALHTAEMIIGKKQSQVKVVSVTEGRSYEECLKELEEVVQQFPDKTAETLILTDIFGGTPANIATYLLLTKENVQVYSGLNIPILLELLLSFPENLQAAKSLIESVYPEALVDITSKVKEGAENGNRVDTY